MTVIWSLMLRTFASRRRRHARHRSGPHMVIPDVLPADMYALLFDTMPPPEGFDIADSVKANFDPDRTTIAPERSRQTWMWFQRDVVDGVLTPLLLDRFQPHLVAAYRDLFGADLVEEALRLPKHAFRGRLMLRRPATGSSPIGICGSRR